MSIEIPCRFLLISFFKGLVSNFLRERCMLQPNSPNSFLKGAAQFLGVYSLLKACLPQGFRKPVTEYRRSKIYLPPLKIEHFGYWGRDEKAVHVSQRYAQYFGQSLLDVGCDQKQLRAAIGRSDLRYVGVDRTPPADLCLDLESDKIPVPDNEFDTVVALDVLEHLDHIREAFAELVRCTRRYLIVSLPNNGFGVYDHMLRGHGIPRFYGLPEEYPPDRHRWFFNFDDADHFLEYCAEKHGMKVVERVAEWRIPGWPWWKRPFHALRFFLGPRTAYFRHRYFQTIWYVFEKPLPNQNGTQ
ncbi:MAG: class I SAM-dependent methyltransferase [Candidatus Sumerlaeia bacterium]|nr:class I SAM-dependent methyltransferase [Candidatus Sumerlaeia bacterium]